ncbi:MAG TPA: hypothetical protein VG711_09535, partial [Phycisphaerales bacterium]|nr:hypothetical protein [Phycisphaerales bacterium]
MVSNTPATASRIINVPQNYNAFGPTPFKIANHLPTHPLFQPDRICTLLKRIPRHLIEIRRVQNTGTNDGMYKRGPLDKQADPVSTFMNLETDPAWMLLHHTWVYDKDYKLVLKDYLRELKQSFPEMNPRLHNIG